MARQGCVRFLKMRYYGQWLRDEAEKRIGHTAPKVEVTSAMVADRPD